MKSLNNYFKTLKKLRVLKSSQFYGDYKIKFFYAKLFFLSNLKEILIIITFWNLENELF